MDGKKNENIFFTYNQALSYYSTFKNNYFFVSLYYNCLLDLWYSANVAVIRVFARCTVQYILKLILKPLGNVHR